MPLTYSGLFDGLQAVRKDIAMFIGFTTKLKHMSHFRFGAGVRMRGSKGWLLLCLFAILNLYWYMILGCLWLMYGCCWLFFYLPIKAIVKAVKKRRIAKKNAMGK